MGSKQIGSCIDLIVTRKTQMEDENMRVLVLSVTAGYGHHQAANVLIEYLKDRGVDCKLIDTFEYINPILSESIAKGYLISTKFTPAVYGKFYRLADKEEASEHGDFSMIGLTNSILSKKLMTLLSEYNPDVIVCTHVFPAQIMTQIRRKGMYYKTIGIITDFTVHPFWEETDIDYYVTADTQLDYQVTKKGIDSSKIVPFGIPIHRKFATKMDSAEARRLLNIGNKITVLVMSGSMGYGNVKENIMRLDRMDMDFQIISVCGNNEALREQIDNMEIRKDIYNFGFVDNIDILMDAADCIITKPGGLTSSESLAKGLPMILSHPIPGQEDRNVEFLVNNGAAMYTSETYPIDEAVYQLLGSKWRVALIKRAMKEIGKPNSTIDLGNFVIELANE